MSCDHLDERKKCSPSLMALSRSRNCLLHQPAALRPACRHYQIAWKRLGVGDRDGARKALRKSTIPH